MTRFLIPLVENNRILRRILLLSFDLSLLFCSFYLVIWLNLENQKTIFINNPYIAIFFIISGIIFYYFTGQYKGLNRYTGSIDLYHIALRNLLLCISTFIFLIINGFLFTYIKFAVSLWFVSTTLIGSYRFLLRDFISKYQVLINEKTKKVIIYGAGSAGAQLLVALRSSGKYNVLFFLDDSRKLSNRKLNGILIKHPNYLDEINTHVDQILIAIPSLKKNQRKKIIFYLKKFNIPILQMPSLEEITRGKTKIDKLSPVEIEDLLGRDPVAPIPSLFKGVIKDMTVCVTGAGGSIGSELCRQIINLKPKRLILIDHSEINLYQIDLELSKSKKEINFISFLGSSTDRNFLNEVFSNYKIDIIFHASAYKHVNLVERNPISGIKNNIISTKLLCDYALNNNVSKFVLISSDKAVRPTNIMGATKRISELICQAYAEKSKSTDNAEKKYCCFLMVRFGNVLGSSGSVVPLFQSQIDQGGPITLSHEKVIRYFMTIQEATQLVIQSIELAKGGDVFLLDMGEPVYIKELAKNMIKLNGLKIKDKDNPNGDIKIKTIGLKEGEKLYEELLIDSRSFKTKHPLIFRAKEKSESYEKIINYFEELVNLANLRKKDKLLDLIKKIVPEWEKPSN